MTTVNDSELIAIPAQGGEYNASDLQVLKGLDAVRKRPGMYIAAPNSRGYQHLLWEIIDNAVDEALAGHCSEISIFLNKDGSAEVHDNGRGIPVDLNKAEGITGLELIFTELHAGGKFGGGGYAVSGGLHGVGASVVNALSSKLEAEVDRGGKTHAVTFSKGVQGEFNAKGEFEPKTGLRIIGKVPATKTGTRVRFWPDKTIFEKGSEFTAEEVHTRARQTAFLVPGLTLRVNDLTGDKETSETYNFEGGMKDLVEYVAKDRPVSDIFSIKGEGKFTETVPMFDDAGHLVNTEIERLMEVEVALRWGTGYETDIRSFVNIVTTPKGGTHVAGFERALNKTVNEFLKSLRVARASDENVIKDDIQEGLTAVVLVRIPEPQFEGQTKEILGTSSATKIVNQVVSDGLKEIFSDPKRKQQIKGVLEKINQAAKTRKAARTAKETIRRKNALESSAMPEKLRDCRSSEMEKCELFIIEGDSAAGTVVMGRDSEFQALMPIRGKILNTMRASEADMLKNRECSAIITAMGAGSGKSFDASSLRYGKFIILADADVDGSHIRCLLLTLCHRYMRPLLEAGRVYAAVPPLFAVEIVGQRNSKRFAYSDEERDTMVAAIEKKGKSVKRPIQRYKGLGEMQAEELRDTTLDSSQRLLRRISVKDAEAAAKMFEMLMGDDVGPRRDFILENGGLIDPEALDL